MKGVGAATLRMEVPYFGGRRRRSLEIPQGRSTDQSRYPYEVGTLVPAVNPQLLVVPVKVTKVQKVETIALFH